MFEAYSVGVRLSLINGVSTGLLLLSKQFKIAGVEAKVLQREITGIKTALMVGSGLTAVGGGLFYLISKSLPAAREYAHQLNVMKMAGLSLNEITLAQQAAWRTSRDVITTSATDNLKSLMDLRTVIGNVNAAVRALPVVAKIGTVLAASGNSSLANHSEDLSFAMAKALDIIGAARTPQEFERQASLMAKVMTAFQGRVTPQMFQGVFAYARQAKFDLSDQFKYELLPTLMLEMSGGGGSAGGGSRGVGPMLAALYRFTNQGIINKKALPLLERLGLVQPGTALRTGTAGTVTAPLKDAGLAASNSILWATQVLDPAIRRVFGKNITLSQERQIIGQAFRGNQLAAAAMMEFISKPQNFFRDQALIRKAMPLNAAYDQAVNHDPETQIVALHKQWANILTDLGSAILPDLISIMKNDLIPLTKDLVGWLGKHPGSLRATMEGLVGVATLLTVSGLVTNMWALGRGIGVAGKLLMGAGGLVTSVTGLGSASLVTAVALWRIVGPLAAIAGIVYTIANPPKGTTAPDGSWHPAWMKGSWLDRTLLQNLSDWTGIGGASPHVPQHGARLPVQVNLNVDGKLVYKKSLDLLLKGMNKPFGGTTGFDNSMGLTPPALGGHP